MKILTAAICALSVGILSAGLERPAVAQDYYGDRYHRSHDDYEYRDYGRRHHREREYRNHDREERRGHNRHNRPDYSKKNNGWVKRFQ